MKDPCDKCEELLQGYLDRELTNDERAEAESHLQLCDYCARRYRFEERIRMFVRTTAEERIPAGLVEKLAQLRGAEPAA